VIGKPLIDLLIQIKLKYNYLNFGHED